MYIQLQTCSRYLLNTCRVEIEVCCNQRPTRLQLGWFGNPRALSVMVGHPTLSGFLTKSSLFYFLITFFDCLFGWFLVGRRAKSRIVLLAASLVSSIATLLQFIKAPGDLVNIVAFCISFNLIFFFFFILGRGCKFNLLFMVPFLLYFCLKGTDMK